MSERNPRKRKRSTESENTLSVKRKKSRAAAGRLQRPSSPYQTLQEHICPYNLRSHAHPHATEVASKVGNSSQASTSDGKGMDWGAERCTICLSTFGRQLVGTPASCAHSFCLKCLQKWAKESNTCPVGRQKFTQICVRKQVRGRVLRKVEVKSPREVIVGFQAPHFTPVHELQISIHQRVDARRPHNEEQLMMIDAATRLAILFTPIL